MVDSRRVHLFAGAAACLVLVLTQSHVCSLTVSCMLLLCLQVAFDLLEDMRASGLTPSTPTCSALIYACLQNNNFAAARKVGDRAWQHEQRAAGRRAAASILSRWECRLLRVRSVV